MTVTATIHTPPPPPQPDTRVVTLQMPYDVAVTLLSLLQKIGGAGNTYRSHTNKISLALAATGMADEAHKRFRRTDSIFANTIPITE